MVPLPLCRASLPKWRSRMSHSRLGNQLCVQPAPSGTARGKRCLPPALQAGLREPKAPCLWIRNGWVVCEIARSQRKDEQPPTQNPELLTGYTMSQAVAKSVMHMGWVRATACTPCWLHIMSWPWYSLSLDYLAVGSWRLGRPTISPASSAWTLRPEGGAQK